MPSPFAALALEFDVLMARAVRRGELPLGELQDTYSALISQQAHAQSQERQVDLGAVLHALSVLPPHIFTSPKVLLVPSLDGYQQNLAPRAHPQTFRSALLPDTTVLAEAPNGRASLFDWAVHLCLLLQEMHKAQLLLAQAAGADDGRAVQPLSLAQIAFALGHDEQALRRALVHTGGTVLDILTRSTPLPTFHIHPNFAPTVQRQAVARHGDRMVAALAEQGLLERPLHLWLGDTSVIDCLSPYSRELRPYLVAWARKRQADLMKTPSPEQVTDDSLYAMTAAFLTTDAKLTSEKQHEERSVGIYHHRTSPPGAGAAISATTFQIVDLGRVDPKLCDVRLPAWQSAGPSPVLLGVQMRDSEHYAPLLEQLIATLGSRLVSMTLVSEGLLQAEGQSAPRPSSHACDIVLPELMIRHVGGSAAPVPTDGLAPHDFAGLTDRPVRTGAVLCAPNMALAQKTYVPGALPIAPACLETGGGALLDVLHEATYQGKLATTVELGWAVVDTPQGQPQNVSLQPTPTTRARHAIAIAALRRITGAVGPQRRPSQPPPSQASSTPKSDIGPRRSTAWAMRVKV